MELKIIQEDKNPLFNRTEVKASVESNTVPSKSEVAELLAKKYSVELGALRVLDVKGKFGNKEFAINANVYQNSEERNETEALTKKEKEAESKPEESAEGEAPAEKAAPATAEPEKVPAEEAIGHNPVEEAKKAEEKAEEDKKEKDKTLEEKQNE